MILLFLITLPIYRNSPKTMLHCCSYWDVVWKGEGVERKKGLLDRIETTNMSVITQNEEQIEISFTRTWNTSSKLTVPLNFDKR